MTEKERAKADYLALREQALKVDRKAKLSKVWMDTHYLLSSAVLVAAIAVNIIGAETVSAWKIIGWIAVVAVFFSLGAIPTRKMLKHKKELHDLNQKLEDLENKYHL